MSKASARSGLHLRWRWRFGSEALQRQMLAHFSTLPSRRAARTMVFGSKSSGFTDPSGALEPLRKWRSWHRWFHHLDRLTNVVSTVRRGKVQRAKTTLGKQEALCKLPGCETDPLKIKEDRNACALFTVDRWKVPEVGTIFGQQSSTTCLLQHILKTISEDFVKGGFVQSEAERKLVLQHL